VDANEKVSWGGAQRRNKRYARESDGGAPLSRSLLATGARSVGAYCACVSRDFAVLHNYCNSPTTDDLYIKRSRRGRGHVWFIRSIIEGESPLNFSSRCLYKNVRFAPNGNPCRLLLQSTLKTQKEPASLSIYSPKVHSCILSFNSSTLSE